MPDFLRLGALVNSGRFPEPFPAWSIRHLYFELLQWLLPPRHVSRYWRSALRERVGVCFRSPLILWIVSLASAGSILRDSYDAREEIHFSPSANLG
jgi:hypothetical protein